MQASSGGSRAEPEPDRGNGDSAVKDEGAFVESRSHGPEVLQCVDRPLYFVAALVDRLVEAGGSTTVAAAPFAVGPLVLRFGDGVLDLASAQVAAVASGAVRLIAAEVVRPGPGVPATAAADADAFQDELRGIAPLAWCDQQGQRAATALPSEVDLGSVRPERRPSGG